MEIKQLYLGCLSQASYLIGDGQACAVIDPRRDVDDYFEIAKKNGWTLRHAILTHFHADFASGHLEAASRGARIYLGKAAKAEYDFKPVGEGDAIEFGDVRLEILETPGHTPESICIVAYDKSKDPSRPEAVFTGDTLFIGDVGRPDLLVSKGKTSAELASTLYDSLHDKVLKLPDSTLVYPGHGAGSACGKHLSSETVSTIGDQKKFNLALKAENREAFIARLIEQPQAPPYFFHDAAYNTIRKPLLEENLEEVLKPLSFEEVLERTASGARVLDTRHPDAFEAEGHLEGSVNVGLGGRFAQWVGTVLSPGDRLILIADPEKEAEAAMRLGRIGYDRIEGFLEGGFSAVKDHPERIRVTDRVTATTLEKLLAEDPAPLVLDVRGRGEYEASHFDGALNIPLPELEERVSEIPSGRRLILHCAGGYRSSIAAGLLERSGVNDFADLIGGYRAWEERRPEGAAR